MVPIAFRLQIHQSAERLSDVSKAFGESVLFGFEASLVVALVVLPSQVEYSVLEFVFIDGRSGEVDCKIISNGVIYYLANVTADDEQY